MESVIPSWLVNIVRGERGHVILTQLATLAHGYSIFVRKEKYGRFPREVFDDTVTVLEFICETSKTSEALQAKRTFTRAIRVVSFPDRIFRARSVKSSLGTRLLSEPLSLDWETTPPAPAPPIPAIGEPHPSFAHANFAANAWEQKKMWTWNAKSIWTIRWKDPLCAVQKRGTTLMKRTKCAHVNIYYSFSYWALYATDFYIEHGKCFKW